MDGINSDVIAVPNITGVSDITGVILAGGQSRRMGFNKAEATVDGETMLARMIEKLREVTRHIIVSSGSITYPDLSWPQVPDEFPQQGPLGGIYSALKASTTHLNLVVACDIPLISVPLLNHIVSKGKENSASITVPVDSNGMHQMLCAVYRRDILPVLKQQVDSNRLKLKALLDLVPVEYIHISSEHPLYQEHAFTNVNTANSLHEARELWHSKQR